MEKAKAFHIAKLRTDCPYCDVWVDAVGWDDVHEGKILVCKRGHKFRSGGVEVYKYDDS